MGFFVGFFSFVLGCLFGYFCGNRQLRDNVTGRLNSILGPLKKDEAVEKPAKKDEAVEK